MKRPLRWFPGAWSTQALRGIAIMSSCAGALAAPGMDSVKPAPAQGATQWLALSDSKLDSMRGGFSAMPGVMVSFGITRTVLVNGVLAGSSGFQIADLRSISTAQAEQLARQTASINLVHIGAGNIGTPSGQPGIAGVAWSPLVIQNTLNDQKIQSTTEINAATNGLSILKTLNLNQTLNDALGARR